MIINASSPDISCSSSESFKTPKHTLKIFEDLWRSLKTDAGPAQVEESSIKAPLSCSPYLTCAAPLVAEPCWTNTSIALDHWTIVHLDRQPAGVQHWKTTVNWWLGSVLLESLQYPQNISNYMVVQITHPQNSHVAGFFFVFQALGPKPSGEPGQNLVLKRSMPVRKFSV